MMKQSLLDEITDTLNGISPERRAELEALALDQTGAMRWVPNDGPQSMAYFSEADDLFYGGEAGGGKSDLILGWALNEGDVSQIYRLHIDDRSALITRLEEILGTRVGYSANDHVWRIDDRRMEFGALSDPNSWKKHQGRPGDFKGWDEVTQFPEEMFRTVNAWNRPARTTKKINRVRTIAAGNPPWTSAGMWVIDYWAAWLADDHPNPAQEGELRYYTTVDGQQDVEVDASWRGRDKNGLEIKPRSRTFIRASLADNPDLAERGYATTLNALPKHLRIALQEGRFRMQLDDDDLQIIPTEYILAAQQRWTRATAEKNYGPMTAMGVDVALGGADRLVIAPLHGLYYPSPIEIEGARVKYPAEAAAHIFKAMRDDPQVNIDCQGGYGSGIAEHMKSNNVDVRMLVASAKSFGKERDPGKRHFANKRAEWVWRLAEALNPELGSAICLPPGRKVLQELTSYREKRFLATHIQIEAKEDQIKRLGRSPDIGDAIIYAWAEASQAERERRQNEKMKLGRARRSPQVYGSYASGRARYSPRRSSHVPIRITVPPPRRSARHAA